MLAAKWWVLAACAVVASCSFLVDDDNLVGARSGDDAGGADGATPSDATDDGDGDGASNVDPCPELPPPVTFAPGPTQAPCGDGGEVVDVLASFAHCGACGHHCGAQACAGGVCEPSVVVTEPTATAICSGRLGNALVWAYAFDGGATVRTRADGPITDLATFPGKGSPYGLLIDDAGVLLYRTTRGVETMGVDGSVLQLSSPGTEVWAADDQTVYSSDTTATSEIRAWPRGGGTSRVIVSAPWVNRISVVDGSLFWMTDAKPGSLHVLGLSSGTAIVLAARVEQSGGLVVDERYVYYADGPKLYRVPRAGGESHLLADISGLASAVATIWVTSVKEKILWLVRDQPETFRRTFMVDRCGRSSPLLIARGAPPCLTAIDDDLYWTRSAREIERFR